MYTIYTNKRQGKRLLFKVSTKVDIFEVYKVFVQMHIATIPTVK